MQVRDLVYLIRKKLFIKNNVILMLVLIPLLLIIFSCVSVIFFVQDYKRTAFLNNPMYREIYITNDKNEYEELEGMKNIETYYSFKLNNVIYNSVLAFNSDIEGEIAVKPLISNNDVKIVDGKNISNDYEMICPKNFYPHPEEYRINYKKFLDGSKYIGKNINVKARYLEGYEEKKEDRDFKIVGVYENRVNTGSIQTCYISKEAFNSLYTDIEGYSSVTSHGEVTNELYYYKGMVVRVNDIDNLSKVENELVNRGFNASLMFNVNKGFVNLLFYVPIFIAIIVLIIALNLIYSFLNKKSNYRKNYLGVLKFSGFTNKDVLKLDWVENIIIINGCFIIALVIYLGVFYIISKWIFYNLVYNNYFLIVPVGYLIVVLILMNLSVFGISKVVTKKALNCSIKDMLEDK